jgi:hypothetical protein
MKRSILASVSVMSVVLLAACEPNPNIGFTEVVDVSAGFAPHELPPGIDTRSGKLSLNNFTKLLAYWDESIQS